MYSVVEIETDANKHKAKFNICSTPKSLNPKVKSYILRIIENFFRYF